ncbi:peptidase M61 [Mangrovimonas sp. YM274]|uniref:M61 family metallopeptidase n=1 Tax=Mangrovimonas sp. YM274 TaxID=3070660 RepID=UPI0027DBD9AD|nr:peptidase M61 [Mangrovimonas sp. YM274]WMI69147.1 peptidase M61 [Mangrovimonas sp. YM274]
MKLKLWCVVGFSVLMWSCGTTKETVKAPSAIKVGVDLVNVTNDQVKVTVTPPAIGSSVVTYHMAKIIPGTYAIADYGRYISEVKAFDSKGNVLEVTKKDVNSWEIKDAQKLHHITYLVDDTFDSEGASHFTTENSQTIFSPAGTNILANTNFVLNMSGFVGYFSDMIDYPYQLSIRHPETLVASSALVDKNSKNDEDAFYTTRFAELVDSPIMYAAPDMSSFNYDGMEVLLSVYSPINKAITSEAFLPDLKKIIVAQKNYLGEVNDTKKYAVLAYITSMEKEDAKGIGALEHSYSTFGVFKETMKSQDLVDIISHEFFHTLTPLHIHSNEIQYFDFSEPKMSKHLWMYEGITEYFAQHFQVYEGLVDEATFLATMMRKIKISSRFNDQLSFTEMSKNILNSKMQMQYINVYQKGALLGMCLDIIIREQSNGELSLMDVMGELAEMYGPGKAFDDDELIPVFVKLTYPEVGEFIDKHIVKGTPIDYDAYLKKMGITREIMPIADPVVFWKGYKPYVGLDQATGRLVAVDTDNQNAFFNAMGIENGDVLLEMNGIAFDSNNVQKIRMMGYNLEEGAPMTIKIERQGEVMELKGKVVLNYSEGEGYKFTDSSKKALKDAWLKGGVFYKN